jgi:hypothetical protein
LTEFGLANILDARSLTQANSGEFPPLINQ